MIAAEFFGLVGIPDCIFDAVGRLGLRGIFGSGPGSGSVMAFVVPFSGVHPALLHASATSSSGWSQPSPLLDLSFQNFPNAWRHTVCVHSGHSAHFRLIYQPCLSRIRPIIRPAMSCRSGIVKPRFLSSVACFKLAYPPCSRLKYSSNSCLPCP